MTAAATTAVTPSQPPSHVNGRASHSAQVGMDRATQVATSTSSSDNGPALTTSAATAA